MNLKDQFRGRYLREGVGIYRGEPQKGPVRRFFEIIGTKWFSLMRANLLYILLSLPLLTNGLGEAGLTYITRSAARGRFAYPAYDFFKTVRRTWKRALPVGIINLAVWALLGYNCYFYVALLLSGLASSYHWLMLGLNLIGMLVYSFMGYYLPIMLVTFDLSLKQMYKNAFMFALHNFRTNIRIFGIMLGVVVALASPLLVMDYRLWLAIFLLLYVVFYPAFRSLLIQFSIFPYIKRNMIDPYYEQHPEADKKAMRALNIEIEEEEDAVFEDRRPEK